MKHLKVILSVCFVALLTGCLNYKVEMKVNDDKSLEFKMTQEIDMSSMKDLDQNNTATSENESSTSENESSMDEYKQDNESVKILKDKGFEIEEKIDNKNYKYSLVVTKKYKSIDDVSSKNKVETDFSNLFKKDFKETYFNVKNGNLYTANFKFSNSDSSEDMSAFASMFDTKFVITLPSKPVSHNATKVSEDGKTLTWTLDISKVNDVNFSFELGESNNNMLYIIIGSVVALVVIVIVVLLIFKKKKTKEQVQAAKE